MLWQTMGGMVQAVRSWGVEALLTLAIVAKIAAPGVAELMPRGHHVGHRSHVVAVVPSAHRVPAVMDVPDVPTIAPLTVIAAAELETALRPLDANAVHALARTRVIVKDVERLESVKAARAAKARSRLARAFRSSGGDTGATRSVRVVVMGPDGQPRTRIIQHRAP